MPALAEVSNGRANLHLHTIFSDGELEPAQVVEAHVAAGFTAIALTDHDTLAGIDALGRLEGRRLRMIAGVELSIEDEPAGGGWIQGELG
ncbi:MAG: PHP domain-containing protein [Chloroflexota bacterium]|nr:MAG: PHP domain-containing protein [Chloroflexota bacterium]